MAAMAPLMFGTAAAGSAAATAGLLGTAGSFAWVPALQTAGTVLSLAGSLSQADEMKRAAEYNARQREVAARAEKQQLDYQAGQSEASSQRQALAARHKAALMISRAQAVSAASGGGEIPESLMAGIIGEGEKAARGALYEGSESAKGARYRGEAGLVQARNAGANEIYSAKNKANATMLSAFGQAGSSFAGRFAPGPAPTRVPTEEDYYADLYP